MTQGIRNILGLPDIEDVLKDQLPQEEETTEADDQELAKIFQEADAKRLALELVEGRNHTKDMEKVFEKALQHANDVADYAWNTEPRFARGLLEVAAGLYGQAISAKNSQRDAQLKAMKLALEQRKLDLDEQKMRHAMGGDQPALEGKATIVEDRNELIKKMREQLKGKTPE